MAMTQASQKIGLNDVRLVRLISDLAVTDVSFSRENFAQRLGDLINFSDSMKLAAFHDELEQRDYEQSPSPASGSGLKDEVLKVRMRLMRAVMDGFTSNNGPARLTFPPLVADMSCDQLLTFEPYHRFYAAHQREFESRIQTLQLNVRAAASGRSERMGRLVAMDEALRDLLAVHTRKSLVSIPKLMAKRFESLRQAPGSESVDRNDKTGDPPPEAAQVVADVEAEEWLAQFGKEMQALLFAELELRLIPILGLVEAVDEKVTK